VRRRRPPALGGRRHDRPVLPSPAAVPPSGMPAPASCRASALAFRDGPDLLPSHAVTRTGLPAWGVGATPVILRRRCRSSVLPSILLSSNAGTPTDSSSTTPSERASTAFLNSPAFPRPRIDRSAAKRGRAHDLQSHSVKRIIESDVSCGVRSGPGFLLSLIDHPGGQRRGPVCRPAVRAGSLRSRRGHHLNHGFKGKSSGRHRREASFP
jgi:hypothetical protein